MKLDNKIIVLTGASSGVGLELLRRLGAANTVIGLSRSAPPQDAIQTARDFTHIAADLANAANVAHASDAINARHPGGVDGLINCAAVQFTPKFIDGDFDNASIATEIAINFTSPIELISGLLDGLLQRPEAFILNVNSGLGIVPKCESAVYCATKAGLDNFSRGLRAQLAGTGLRVQQAFLPLVDTPMTQGRGSGKLSASEVARAICNQIESGKTDLDVGKVGLLRVINRVFPALANRIMQKGDT